MRISISYLIIIVSLIIGASLLPAFAQNRLVDMVPESFSKEVNQDSEPSIAVNLNNYSTIVGSAFTFDNVLGGAGFDTINGQPALPMNGPAPLYVSTDRGNTWTFASIVPCRIGSPRPFLDITLSFSNSYYLYAATLSGAYDLSSFANQSVPMTALRSQYPFFKQMTTIDYRKADLTGSTIDQPRINVLNHDKDRLYVGYRNSDNSPNTITIDVSQNADSLAPGIQSIIPSFEDKGYGGPVVVSPNADGTIYAAFIRKAIPELEAYGLVVLRDDNWGKGPKPFTNLSGIDYNGQYMPGRFVGTDYFQIPAGYIGQERLSASNVSIASDPNDSSRVYVAWGDCDRSNNETIHVRRSIDRGLSWSNDLLTVQNAVNPEVAINSWGIVGLLYQQFVSGRWETHFVRTTNGTTFDTPGIMLANQDGSEPTMQFDPYLGDYAALTSAGKDFMGIFSASNYPDKANFMPGVQYQREVDWATHTLFTDSTRNAAVVPSIDPFFFEIDMDDNVPPTLPAPTILPSSKSIKISGIVIDNLSGPDISANSGNYTITNTRTGKKIRGNFTVKQDRNNLQRGTYSFEVAFHPDKGTYYLCTIRALDKAGNKGAFSFKPIIVK